MAAFDTTGELTIASHSNIAARTSTLTTTGVDIGSYKGTLTVIQAVGTVSGTSPTLAGKIQDCDTVGGTYADITGYTFTQVTASDSTQTLRVDTRLARQFIRYVGTIGGTTPSFTMGVLFVGQKNLT